MDIETLHILDCPKCSQDSGLTLVEEERKGAQIESGFLKCDLCSRKYPIRGGIPRFPIVEPTEEFQIRDNVAVHSHPMGCDVHYWPPENDWKMKTTLAPLQKALNATADPNGRILDLGAGFGYYWRYLDTKAVPILVDFSLRTLLLAKKRFELANNRVECIFADITALPFRRRSFEVIVSIQAYQHVASQKLRDSGIRMVSELVSDTGVFYYNHLNTPLVSGLVGLLPGRQLRAYRTYEPYFLETSTVDQLKYELLRYFSKVSIRGRFPWRLKLGRIPLVRWLISRNEKFAALFARDLDAICRRPRRETG